MIDGARVAPKANYVMRDFHGIRAKRGGLLFTLAKLGELIEKGQPLARTVYPRPGRRIVYGTAGWRVRSLHDALHGLDGRTSGNPGCVLEENNREILPTLKRIPARPSSLPH